MTDVLSGELDLKVAANYSSTVTPSDASPTVVAKAEVFVPRKAFLIKVQKYTKQIRISTMTPLAILMLSLSLLYNISLTLEYEESSKAIFSIAVPI